MALGVNATLLSRLFSRTALEQPNRRARLTNIHLVNHANLSGEDFPQI